MNFFYQILADIPTLGPNTDVSVFAVFAAGLVAFFSPCVLPIIPLYIGYLSGKTFDRPGESPEDPELAKKAKKKAQRTTAINTLFFVLGISTVYLVMGYAANSVGRWFRENGHWFSMVGGIVIVVLGVLQLYSQLKGVSLTREHRLPFRLDKLKMNPLTAFLLGFTFSFAWTPCVGPILVSVIAMVAQAGTKLQGLLLMLVYTLGFTLPLLVFGFFTEAVMGFFRKNQKVVKYTGVIGAVLMIAIGVLLLTGQTV